LKKLEAKQSTWQKKMLGSIPPHRGRERKKNPAAFSQLAETLKGVVINPYSKPCPRTECGQFGAPNGPQRTDGRFFKKGIVINGLVSCFHQVLNCTTVALQMAYLHCSPSSLTRSCSARQCCSSPYCVATCSRNERLVAHKLLATCSSRNVCVSATAPEAAAPQVTAERCDPSHHSQLATSGRSFNVIILSTAGSIRYERSL
jgi:hypothetical protein